MEPQNRKSEDWQVILHPCQGAECYVTAANHHGYSNALVKRRAWLQLIVSTCGMLGKMEDEVSERWKWENQHQPS